ncbi:sulfate reduction electron transfer complex DsrMKJOP subunit DsrM, partial [bacterium]|nr:sulfate reduction electron transfer complex DsrMKJOP subunit DsrM [bacterium]
MNAWYGLFTVLILIALALLGIEQTGLYTFFGAVVPMVAIVLFLFGITYRVLKWARAPVPFKITTTTGQQKSLPWIKSDPLEAPATKMQVMGRMLLEILLFRSLFRNTKAELKNGSKLVYGATKWLWVGGLVFHYSFLVIFLRHFKYFAEPTPFFVTWLQNLDGFFQVGLPIIYLTDFAFVAGVSFLFLRRVWDPKLRYISLTADYFPLFLLLGIATTGILMRYFLKVDLVAVKELGMGLLMGQPVVSAEIGSIFYVHFFLVSVLIAYFPFSKLMHMG